MRSGAAAVRDSGSAGQEASYDARRTVSRDTRRDETGASAGRLARRHHLQSLGLFRPECDEANNMINSPATDE
jgi:hypothetical protein